MKHLKINIIILNFNGKDFVLGCLESVKKLKKDNFEIETIVVDNGSTDQSREQIKKHYPEIVVLENKKNLGFSEGNNVGLEYSLRNGADWVFLLNPDTLVDSDLLIQLIKVGKSDPKIGLLSPKIYFAPGYEFHKERYREKDLGKVIWYAGGKMDWQNIIASHRKVDEVDQGEDETRETDFVTGCAMLVKSQVLEKIGFFEEKYFLYLEDNDFSQRAKKEGFKIVYVPQGKVWHLNAASSEVGGHLQDYFLTRNRMLFGLRYGSFRAKISLIKESLKLILSGRPWQKKGIRDFYLGKWGKGSW